MTAVTTRVDPITAAVIAGALDSIAVEMGHKLARMAYSSIIRESEDFGCVLCDEQGRQLCESAQSTPLQSGPIPGYIARHQPPLRRARRRVEARRRRDPQPRLLRRVAPARRRLRRSRLPRRRARRLLGDDRTPPRPRRAHARAAAGSSTPTDAYAEGPAAQRDQDRGGRPPQRRGLADPPRQLPRAAPRRRRHGGAGRRRQDRRRPVRRADRPLRPRDGARPRART